MHEEQRAIEKRLHTLAYALMQYGLDPAAWLDSPEIGEFTKTLYELADFHESHGEIRETVMGYEALNAYLIVNGYLEEMLHDNADAAYYERLRSKRSYIRIKIDEIIAEGYAKSYYDEEERNSGSADT